MATRALPVATEAAPSSLPAVPGLLRRLACVVYESLLVLALLFLSTLAFLLASSAPPETPLGHSLLQAFLLLILIAYFVTFWTRSGQTLAMKTWRIRVVDNAGAPLTTRRALLRFFCAIPCVLVGGLGLLWALVDRDRQFLHDRLAGTRLVVAGEG